MNTSEHPAATIRQRKIHYVDESIQKWLLVGLVLLEVALAAGLAWLMYGHLNQIVEDNLYRIHLAEAQPILSQLLGEALKLLGIFVAVNVVALVLVDVLWRRYVHSILAAFMQLMRKTSGLDYSADPAARTRHQLLDLAEEQRELDRARLTAVRGHVLRLAEVQQDPRAMAETLAALEAQVPKGRASRPERRVNRV